MALINIDYGSLASSEIMNKNFLYLEDKISDTSESIMTSISSILSNIATINTRLNEVTDEISDSVQKITSTVEDYKAKTKLLVNKASMIPCWENAVSIALSLDSAFTVSSNGYILLITNDNSGGNLIVNNKSIPLNDEIFTSNFVSVPVRDGDVVFCSANLNQSYFIPSIDVSVENF